MRSGTFRKGTIICASVPFRSVPAHSENLSVPFRSAAGIPERRNVPNLAFRNAHTGTFRLSGTPAPVRNGTFQFSELAGTPRRSGTPGRSAALPERSGTHPTSPLKTGPSH